MKEEKIKIKHVIAVSTIALLMSHTINSQANEKNHSTNNTTSNPLREAYFGETHMHTAYSLDAFIGGTRLTPDDAYRFAKGETVIVDGKKAYP